MSVQSRQSQNQDPQNELLTPPEPKGSKVAKAKSSDDVILDAVRKAISALPDLLPLSGTKALFSAKQADLAERAVSEGYLAKKELIPAGAKGKKPKPVVCALVTEVGARKVAEAGGAHDLKSVLESLRSAVEKLGAPPARQDPAEFRTAIEKATTTCVNAINTAFAGLRDDVLRAVAPSGSSAIDPAPILTGIAAALGKIEPTVVKIPVLAEQAAPAPTPKPTTPATTVADEIITFVSEWAREKSVGCQFDVLMEHLRRRQSDLTIGAFQDALRNLYDAGRIRLTGWPKMLDDMPEPELALFVSSKVMYYAHPAQGHG